MKKIIACIIFSVFCSSSYAQNSENFGEGVLLWGGYDILEQEVVGELGKKADIISLEKSKDKYTIYGKDVGGSLIKISFKKLNGFDSGGKYVDENGDVYYIKDLLNNSVKAIDLINTRPLPGMPPNIFMILRVLIK